MKAAKHCIRARLPGFFAYVFSRKRSVKQRKNAAQCISSNLKATRKNTGTFENTPKKVDFPLSIVFDQALQLSIATSQLVCGNFVSYCKIECIISIISVITGKLIINSLVTYLDRR